MKINELWMINILDEMAGLMVNYRIEDNFYDYYMYNEINWLVDNAEKIGSDFYDNIDRFKWQFENNYDYYRNIKFYGIKKMSKKEFLETIKELKGEK